VTSDVVRALRHREESCLGRELLIVFQVGPRLGQSLNERSIARTVQPYLNGVLAVADHISVVSAIWTHLDIVCTFARRSGAKVSRRADDASGTNDSREHARPC
jgi:hypothetical protein